MLCPIRDCRAFPEDATGQVDHAAHEHVTQHVTQHGVLGRRERGVTPTDPEWGRQWYLDSGGAVDPDGCDDLVLILARFPRDISSVILAL